MVPIYTEAANAYADRLMHLPLSQAEHSIEGLRTRGIFPFSVHYIQFTQKPLQSQSGCCLNWSCALQLICLVVFVRPSACNNSPPIITVNLLLSLAVPGSHAAPRRLYFLSWGLQALWALHRLWPPGDAIESVASAIVIKQSADMNTCACYGFRCLMDGWDLVTCMFKILGTRRPQIPRLRGVKFKTSETIRNPGTNA